MPKNTERTSRLVNKLGYRIDNSGKTHELAIKQYAKHHKHYPVFGKIAQ